MSAKIRVASSDVRAEVSGSERWLRHSDLLAIAAVAAGFVIRILSARGTYLSGDEALQLQLANEPGLINVYWGTLANAHPPLFFFLLRLWSHLGDLELFLRLLPILFGTAFLWVTYRWALGLFGRFAGLIVLLLLSFSPALIALSAQVRSYTLLLLLMAATLATFEKALNRRSAGRMATSSALLCLTALTHYSAFFLALTLFAYGLIRLRQNRLSARVGFRLASSGPGQSHRSPSPRSSCFWLSHTSRGFGEASWNARR
jgi:uncharacterized membrane protein